MRRGIFLAVVLLLAGCGTGDQSSGQQGQSERSTETSTESVVPSITREVPPEQRRRLAGLSAEQLCALVSPNELGQLAFTVTEGRPREIGFDRPSKGCGFAASSGTGSILIGSQPSDYGELGTDDVQLGPVRGTKTLSASNCSVYSEISGAILQVTVTVPEADSDQCEMAESIAQYVIPALKR